MLALYQNFVQDYLAPVASTNVERPTITRAQISKKSMATAVSSRYPEKTFVAEVLARTFVFMLFLGAAMLGKVFLDFVVTAVYGHQIPPHSVNLVVTTLARGMIIVNASLFTVHLLNASRRLILNS